MRFCVTFGQDHPLRDSWVEVEADNEEVARKAVFGVFDMRWAFMYKKEHFNPDYFPGGRVGRTIEG